MLENDLFGRHGMEMLCCPEMIRKFYRPATGSLNTGAPFFRHAAVATQPGPSPRRGKNGISGPLSDILIAHSDEALVYSLTNRAKATVVVARRCAQRETMKNKTHKSVLYH